MYEHGVKLHRCRVVLDGKMKQASMAFIQRGDNFLIKTDSVPFVDETSQKALVGIGDGNVYTFPVVGSSLIDEESDKGYTWLSKVEGITEKDLETFAKEL